MMNPVDAGIESLFHIAAHLPVLDLVGRGTARRRHQAIEALVPEATARLRPLWGPVMAGEPAATTRYDQIVLSVLHGLRADITDTPLGTLDRWLYRDGQEILDRHDLPESQRLPVLEVLDRMNQHLGSYRKWCDQLEPLVRRAGAEGRPVAIHDLAAGHGGFAIELQHRFGARVAVTASDLREEYLDLGRARAAARGVAVRFVQQDATHLSNLRGALVDVFLCTQSLHHFPPGMVARMLGEAARAARVGVRFIDGERGYVPLLVLPALMGLYGRSWPAVHDTWVSLRRMYLAEELLLLARLAPGLPADATVYAERVAPGHGQVTIIRG